MLLCKQYPSQSEISIIIYVIIAIIGTTTIIMSGKGRVFFDLTTFRTKKRNQSNIISNKFFILFVSLTEATWIWLALCIITGFFITASSDIIIKYLSSALDEDSWTWCSLFYNLYSDDLLAPGLLFGLIISLPISQRILVPLGKHTSVTMKCTRSISLHIDVDPNSPDKIIFVRAKTAVKQILKSHPNKEIILSSWLIAKDAAMPQGADKLRATYAKIANIQYPHKVKLISLLLVAARFIALTAASREIYKKHKNLGPIQSHPTNYIQVIINSCPNHKVDWHYRKSSLIELIALISHYPEQLKDSNGYIGVVKISQ